MSKNVVRRDLLGEAGNTRISSSEVRAKYVDAVVLNVTTINLVGTIFWRGEPIVLVKRTTAPTIVPTASPIPAPTHAPVPNPTSSPTHYASEYYRTGCLTWSAARAACQSGGGDLVVITNAAKNAEATAYMQSFSDYSSCQGPYPWIGASGCSGSSCNWVDGSPWSYTGPNFGIDDPMLHFYTSGRWGTWCSTCQVNTSNGLLTLSHMLHTHHLMVLREAVWFVSEGRTFYSSVSSGHWNM